MNWFTKLFPWETDNRIADEADQLKVRVPGDRLPEDFHPINDTKEHQTYYPWAIISGDDGMATQGHYEHGYPLGAIVHYHAGRNDLLSFLRFMRSKRYCTFIIDRSGGVTQDFPITKWGYHAGKSKWPGISDKTVHKQLVGIEIMSAGRLTQTKGEGDGFKTWWGDSIPETQVRSIPKHDHIRAGHYHKFTFDQEKSLLQLLFWLEGNGNGKFLFDLVLGHNEVSPGRKSDPGGSLSMEMIQFRNVLKQLKSRDDRHVSNILKRIAKCNTATF